MLIDHYMEATSSLEWLESTEKSVRDREWWAEKGENVGRGAWCEESVKWRTAAVVLQALVRLFKPAETFGEKGTSNRFFSIPSFSTTPPLPSNTPTPPDNHFPVGFSDTRNRSDPVMSLTKKFN